MQDRVRNAAQQSKLELTPGFENKLKSIVTKIFQRAGADIDEDLVTVLQTPEAYTIRVNTPLKVLNKKYSKRMQCKLYKAFKDIGAEIKVDAIIVLGFGRVSRVQVKEPHVTSRRAASSKPKQVSYIIILFLKASNSLTRGREIRRISLKMIRWTLMQILNTWVKRL